MSAIKLMQMTLITPHNDDRSIIDIIKENVDNEKEYNAEIINIPKEQIIYFKNEIIHKNTLIENLIIELNTRNNDLPKLSADVTR